MATANCGEEDEWELINDDGFVYKRKKRRLDPTATTSAPAPPDPELEEKNRKERKRRALLNLRAKYQKEIDQWELLSNTLKAMQEKHLIRQNREFMKTTMNTTSSSTTIDLPLPSAQSSETSCRRLVEELCLRVEAEEEMIRNISKLCDMAEAICNAQEEKMKQSFIDLPIWASPGELMKSLCNTD